MTDLNASMLDSLAKTARKRKNERGDSYDIHSLQECDGLIEKNHVEQRTGDYRIAHEKELTTENHNIMLPPCFGKQALGMNL